MRLCHQAGTLLLALCTVRTPRSPPVQRQARTLVATPRRPPTQPPPGIPKFYRWLSERYPLLNMSVAATEAPPEMDNLYLDMNGIIHNCTHANDPNLKLTETEMVVRIFTYLDKLIQIIKPQKLVFMAIDGAVGAAGAFWSLLLFVLCRWCCRGWS